MVLQENHEAITGEFFKIVEQCFTWKKKNVTQQKPWERMCNSHQGSLRLESGLLQAPLVSRKAGGEAEK